MTPRIATCLTALALCLAAAPAAAESVTIRYAATLIGLPVGKAHAKITAADGRFSIDANGRVAGITRMLSDGRGTITAKGRIGGAGPAAESYRHVFISDDDPEEVTMRLEGGTVKDVAQRPDRPPKRGTVTLEAAHRRGVVDPASGFLVPLGEPDPCGRTIPVFDGDKRFDIVLTARERRAVQVAGYAGTAIVCTARYRPLAGHRPHRRVEKFMTENRMEVWFAPVRELGLWVPVRAEAPTMVGPLVIRMNRLRPGAGS